MQYLSTRGDTHSFSFREAVLEGLARDGGLLVPQKLPDFSSKLTSLIHLPYPELAREILSEFVGDDPELDLNGCCTRAYSENYGGPVAPLIALDQRFVLELFHGPTLAFKDVALQLLGQFFEVILRQQNSSLNIVAATSGDTGSAAIHGLRTCQHVNLFVTHPAGKIADLQRLQMTTVLNDNIHNISVDGSFDDCQNMVKALSSDLDFKQKHRIGAVNSINWARIAAQIVYYFAAYFQTPGAAALRPAVFSVPTGNFGNILAAEYARRMGLPIGGLVLASNENDILPVFFNTGLYRRGVPKQTHSPAMDIQIASNFERYLFLLADGCTDTVRNQMETFQEKGEVLIDGARHQEWRALACSNSQTLETISEVAHRTGRVLDPHTATAWWALEQHESEFPKEWSKVVVGTAHPAKFGSSLRDAVAAYSEQLTHPRLEELRNLPERCYNLSPSVEELKKFVSKRASTLQGGVFQSPKENRH